MSVTLNDEVSGGEVCYTGNSTSIKVNASTGARSEER